MSGDFADEQFDFNKESHEFLENHFVHSITFQNMIPGESAEMTIITLEENKIEAIWNTSVGIIIKSCFNGAGENTLKGNTKFDDLTALLTYYSPQYQEAFNNVLS